MNNKTPIAIFVYNRPHHLQQLFDSLLQCSRLNECDVYIYCDGVKKHEHKENVELARKVVWQYAARINANIVERIENFGLSRSIVSAVSDLCSKYGRAIVLEDDFIIHPFFLDFMIQALDRYVDDEQVAQVAGYLPPINPKINTDAFFLPLTTSCGWATWQRAWKLFSWDTETALKKLDSDPALSAHFDLDRSYPYTDMLHKAAAGELNSWAIRWYWYTFSQGKLTLYPRRSLIWVGGFDELATHTKSNHKPKFYDQSLGSILKVCWNDTLVFPDNTQINLRIFDKLKQFLIEKPKYAIISQIPSIFRHIWYEIKKLW